MNPTDARLRDALTQAARRRGDAAPGAADRLAALLSLDAWFDATGPDGDDARRGRMLRRRFESTQLVEAGGVLSAVLSAGGVRHCFLKGAALTGRVYAPGERTFVDLDLLVHPDDVQRCWEAAATAGYTLEPEAERNAPPTMRRGYDLTGPEVPGVGPVRLDANWAIAPVNHLLTHADRDALAPIWDRVEVADGLLPAPHPADHLALIIHHLVHHDLLHMRGLVDVVRLLDVIPSRDDPQIERMAGRLGVLRLTHALVDLATRQLAVPPREGIGEPPGGWRGRRLRALVEPSRWFAWAADVPDREHLEITPARIRRRLVVVDRLRDVVSLARDVLLPPMAYLRWRWDGRSAPGAWLAHLARVAGKSGA